MFAFLSRSLSQPEIAIDVGTAETRIAWESLACCITSPSIAGLTPAISRGAVANCDAAVEVLRPLFYRARRWLSRRLKVMACVCADASAEERAAVEECVTRAGA